MDKKSKDFCPYFLHFFASFTGVALKTLLRNVPGDLNRSFANIFVVWHANCYCTV